MVTYLIRSVNCRTPLYVSRHISCYSVYLSNSPRHPVYRCGLQHIVATANRENRHFSKVSDSIRRENSRTTTQEGKSRSYVYVRLTHGYLHYFWLEKIGPLSSKMGCPAFFFFFSLLHSWILVRLDSLRKVLVSCTTRWLLLLCCCLGRGAPRRKRQIKDERAFARAGNAAAFTRGGCCPPVLLRKFWVNFGDR